MAGGAVAENQNHALIQRLIDQGRFSGTQAMVIAVALILNMLDGFDVTAMAFTAHSIGEQLAIAPDQLGIVFSVALAGMMIGAMFVAPLSDVVGRRSMIMLCTAVIGGSMVATGYATSLWQLVVLRLITGLGVGGMLASLAAISAEYTPDHYRSLAVSRLRFCRLTAGKVYLLPAVWRPWQWSSRFIFWYRSRCNFC